MTKFTPKYLTIKVISFVIVIALVIFYNIKFWEVRKNKLAKIGKSLLTAYPDVKYLLKEGRVERVLNSSGVYRLNNGNILIITGKICSDIKGYVDQIVLGIVTDSEGKILNLKVLATKENIPRAHLVEREEYLRQFKGFNPLRENKKFDIITRATYSSRCVINTVREGVKRAFSLLKRGKGKESTSSLLSSRELIILAVLLFPIVLIIAKKRWLLWVWWLLVILGGGLGLLSFGGKSVFLSLSLADIGRFFTLDNWEIFSFMGIVFIILVLTTLLFGRYYCSYLCPYGLVLALGVKLKRHLGKLGSLKITFSQSIFLLLAHTLFFAFFFWRHYEKMLQNKLILSYDPLVSLFIFNLSATGIVLIWGITLFSLFYPRFWCKALCPLGEVFEAVSLKPLFPMKIGEKDCTSCKLCMQSCSYGAIYFNESQNRPFIAPELCFRCLECLEACPQQRKDQ